MFGLFVTGFLGISAMAVDMGNNWQEKRELTNAVDSAALAAASEYAFGGQGCLNEGATYLLSNRPDAVITSCTSHGDEDFGWVVITAEVQVDQYFGKVLGVNSVTASVTSNAMWGSPSDPAVKGARPFGVCLETLAREAEFQDWQANGGTSDEIRIYYDKDHPADCTGSSDVPCVDESNIDEIVNVAGDAYYVPQYDYFILTPDRYNKAGTVMSTERIDITEDFNITFDVYLGKRDNGADGIGFVFHNDPSGQNAIGFLGGGLGMSTIRNSIGIEFDMWHNTESFYDTGQQASDDVWQDHTAIYDPEHLITPDNYENNYLYGADSRLTPLVTLNNIEDRRWHTAEVNWDSSLQQLSYTFDGFQVGLLTIDLADDHFEGDYAHFGFAASTGGAKNIHALMFDEFDATLEGQDPNCSSSGSGDSGSSGDPIAGNWGMIDFDGGNNSNNDTKEWIENGYSGYVDPGTFEGDPGALSGSHSASLYSLFASQEVFTVPLFDYAEGNGANATFDVTQFAYATLNGYNVTGSQSGRYLELRLHSVTSDQECCAEPSSSDEKLHIKATRIVSLDDDGNPVRRGS